MTDLEIIYRDPHFVAINKPHGLLVHRSRLARDASEFAVQVLRKQLGQHVYPAHRIDRKTSGVLLFSLDKSSDTLMQKMFASGAIDKSYLAIVRGYTDDEGLIDYPLKKENGKMQEALTRYKTLERGEIIIPGQKHETSRYSLLKAKPETGRMHQIRRHLAHIFHPIIGDRPHGCNKQNRMFKENFDMITMLLHAWQVRFRHPISGIEINILAEPGQEFVRISKILGFNLGF